MRRHARNVTGACLRVCVDIIGLCRIGLSLLTIASASGTIPSMSSGREAISELNYHEV